VVIITKPNKKDYIETLKKETLIKKKNTKKKKKENPLYKYGIEDLTLFLED